MLYAAFSSIVERMLAMFEAGAPMAPAMLLAGAIGAPASNIASVLSTIEEKAA